MSVREYCDPCHNLYCVLFYIIRLRERERERLYIHPLEVNYDLFGQNKIISAWYVWNQVVTGNNHEFY